MINVSNEANTRFGEFAGYSSSLLIGECNTGCAEISIQITNVKPGKMQTLHNHPQNQCYYIIQGKGLIIIDEEEKEVFPGDAVLIPSNAVHGIKNIGDDNLQYLTANKAFGVEREKELWSLEKP